MQPKDWFKLARQVYPVGCLSHEGDLALREGCSCDEPKNKRYAEYPEHLKLPAMPNSDERSAQEKEQEQQEDRAAAGAGKQNYGHAVFLTNSMFGAYKKDDHSAFPVSQLQCL